MLLPGQASLISRYVMGILRRLRGSDACDAGERLEFTARTLNWIAEAMDARLLTTEDVEGAMLQPIGAGLLQLQRRVLTRWRTKAEAERGFAFTDHDLVAMFPDIDGELLAMGFVGEMEGDE